MLCERCGKNEAMIHVVKIVNGKKSEAMLCEKCARELSNMPLKQAINSESKSFLENRMKDFFNMLEKNNKFEVVCKKCGTTYSQFKKTGKLGCGECYDSFKEELASKVQEIQGHTEHIGKIPVREEKKVISNKKVNELKKALQEAIIEEEYEKAAVIRDEIKFYESMKGSGVND